MADLALGLRSSALLRLNPAGVSPSGVSCVHQESAGAIRLAMARIGWLLTLIAALPVLIAPARGAPRYPAPHLTPPRAARCSLACWLRLRGGAEEDSAGSGSGGSAGAAEVMTQTEAGAVDAADASAVPKESDSRQGEEESSSSEESSVARGARGRTTRGGRGGKSASGTRGGRGGKAAPANSAARGGKRAVAGAQALPRGKKRPAVEEGEASTESSVEDKQTLQVAAKPTKKKPLSQMSLHERKSEILLRQYAQVILDVSMRQTPSAHLPMHALAHPSCGHAHSTHAHSLARVHRKPSQPRKASPTSVRNAQTSHPRPRTKATLDSSLCKHAP